MAGTLPLKHTDKSHVLDDRLERFRSVYHLLTRVYTLEQLEQIAKISLQLSAKATEDRCQQQIVVILGANGFPSIINVTQGIRFVKRVDN